MESEIKKSKKDKRHKKKQHSKHISEVEQPTEDSVQIEHMNDEEGSKIKKHKKNKRKKANDLREGDNIDVQEDNQVATEEVCSDDDPDAEDKPKRKKKKKPMVAEPSSDKKGKKSIRQMKKEKHLQRQAEAQALSKEQLKSDCLSYLSQWKHDKQNWKFMKVKQVWLYKNKFSNNLIPDASWPLLLEYFESAKGNIRTMLLDDANKVIQKMDEWIESQNGKAKNNEENEDEESEESSKPDDTSYKRARDLIQCLQE